MLVVRVTDDLQGMWLSAGVDTDTEAGLLEIRAMAQFAIDGVTNGLIELRARALAEAAESGEDDDDEPERD